MAFKFLGRFLTHFSWSFDFLGRGDEVDGGRRVRRRMKVRRGRRREGLGV